MKDINIASLVKPNVRSLRAYQAEEVPCKVKLDANESPYSALSAGRSFRKNLQTLNRYPDPEAKKLRGLIAKEFRVKPENVLHGNGSDELIYYLITTFGGPVLYPVPTFSMYGIISQALGEGKIEIPLDDKFDLNTNAFLDVVKKKKPKLIFLSSPNNPTGNNFSIDRISKIIESASSPVTRHPSLVVVDEAYQAFSGKKSFLPLLKKYKNLAVLKTLSKIGLAALRTGFLIADAEIINEVNKVRLPFNVNSLSQAVAIEALKNKKQMRSYISSIVSERKRLVDEMRKIEGVKPYPSDANFILFKVADADAIHKGLLKRGILVRNMTGAVKDCLRVTVGTPKENEFFLKNLKRSL
ncbi:MAG: histidinol-phosphate transaminase [Nitrospirae bacterium]|nr:histidinol-phosphate transaminase [Nitrospirota bacterium]